MTPWYNKRAQWLEPFFEDARNILPKSKMKRIRAIRLLNPPSGYTRTAGQLTYDMFDNSYTLFIHTGVRRLQKPGTKRFTFVKFETSELLETFAHELAHLVYEDHTPSHNKLTYRLARRFMTILTHMGYESNEAEAKKKFWESL
jgi:hypothetical protein